MSQIYYGLALFITGGRFMSFKLAFEPLRLLRIGELVPITLLMFLALVFLAYILVNRTKFGRRIVAIGGNEENARLSGIPVDKYKIFTYAISGIYCGVAAVIFASRLDAVTASGGEGYELNALTGAIIGGVTFDGGKGTVIGAFLGCMFMGVLGNVMNVLGASPALQAMISGTVIVAAVVISNIGNLRKK
jgi:ribose/xylose/arabinose/galactoside ABC-type transport system permease subunit